MDDSKAAAGAEIRVVTTVGETVVDPAAKRALGARSGAELVDKESVAFAQVAANAGWRWAVVRGVSDGVEEALPADIDRWVTPAGRPRRAFVLRRLARKPSLWPLVRRLKRHTAAAMDRVAEELHRLL